MKKFTTVYIYIVVLISIGVLGGIILHFLHPLFFDIYLSPQSSIIFDILIGLSATFITYTIYLLTKATSYWLHNLTFLSRGLYCLSIIIVLIVLLALSTFGFNPEGLTYSFLSLGLINFFIPYLDNHLKHIMAIK